MKVKLSKLVFISHSVVINEFECYGVLNGSDITITHEHGLCSFTFEDQEVELFETGMALAVTTQRQLLTLHFNILTRLTPALVGL